MEVLFEDTYRYKIEISILEKSQSKCCLLVGVTWVWSFATRLLSETQGLLQELLSLHYGGNKDYLGGSYIYLIVIKRMRYVQGGFLFILIVGVAEVWPSWFIIKFHTTSRTCLYCAATCMTGGWSQCACSGVMVTRLV